MGSQFNNNESQEKVDTVKYATIEDDEPSSQLIDNSFKSETEQNIAQSINSFLSNKEFEFEVNTNEI